MKKKIFLPVAFLFIVNCSIAFCMIKDGNSGTHNKLNIDSITPGYFPLSVGNVYKYHFGASSGFNYDYNVRILKDTVINSRKYFIADHYFPGYIGNFIRYDSATGNIYTRVNSGYCSYSPFEELIDSLRSRKGDTTIVCTPILKHYCNDTGYASLFGNQLKKKGFARYGLETAASVSYGMGIGIIFTSYSDFWGIASESLTGCFVNGVLYGDTVLTDIKNFSSETELSFLLLQNYPNPFNPVTLIRYSLSGNRFITLKVFDALGKEVAVLVNEKQNAGTYQVMFDGSNLSSGIYFYKIETGEFVSTKKMLLIK